MAEEMVIDAPVEQEYPTTDVEEVEQAEGDVTDIGDQSVDDETDTDEDDLDTPDEEEAEEEEENAASPVNDGRKMPDGMKKAISSLKATSPEVAKQIKGLYWSDQEYRAAFAKPSDAVSAKQFLEEIGGQEGVQEIAAEREEWQQIDRDFADGKPEFAKSIADSNPEAFLKTAPHVINEFAQRAPEQYAYYSNRLTLNRLENAGISLQNLRAAYDARKESDPGAAAVIADFYNTLLDINQSAAQFEQKRTDPREEQLKQRETAFEDKRRADFEIGVATQADKFIAEKMQPEIDKIIAGRKIDPDAMKGYQKMVKAEVDRLFEAIPGIEDKLEAKYRTGNSQESLSYIQNQYTRLLPTAAKIIEPFLRNIAGSAAKSKPVQANGQRSAGTPAAGEVVLKEMPSWDQLDPVWRSRVDATAELIQGRAVLRNGKRASGWA